MDAVPCNRQEPPNPFSTPCENGLGRSPVGAAGNGESDPRARSTRNGPQHSSRRPTSERPRRPGDYDVNGWPPTIFSPERRSPTGANGTSGRTSPDAALVDVDGIVDAVELHPRAPRVVVAHPSLPGFQQLDP